MRSAFSDTLLAWYHLNARELPWRGGLDAYAVWVSEVMLQQTRVETVIPYFQRWMQKFPDVMSLAQASQQEVLSAWEGLGYYSRARNLHRAARILVDEFNGELPRDSKSLRSLPGIGQYTAGAIASIAFDQDEPALDGNIRRVMARVFNVGLPARSPEGEKRLWMLVAEHLPPGEAGDYNQALMELGALVCTPRDPACGRCPVMLFCQARSLGIQGERPVMAAKAAIPHYVVTAGVIERQGEVLIAQRPPAGLLGGLWEFPGGKLQTGEDLIACLKREISEELGVVVSLKSAFGVYSHAYTHFRITLHAFCCRLEGTTRPSPLQVHDLRWVKPAELAKYPMGKIDRQIAVRIMEQGRC